MSLRPKTTVVRYGCSRVGIDLVSVPEVRDAVADWGAHYLDRVFTAREQADCRHRGRFAPERLAARFAAKEAAVKTLRPGPREAVPWTDIEVTRRADGSPDLHLHGAAAALASRQDLRVLDVSLTHDGAGAAAVVLATTRFGGPR